MMLLRSRNYELDPLRIFDPGFNKAWTMFFGTCPPALSRAGVFLTLAERKELSEGIVPASFKEHSRLVEPYDPRLHNIGNTGGIACHEN